MFLLSNHCFAQWNPNPVDSRLVNSTRSTFEHKVNDIYVYQTKMDSGNYTTIITLLSVNDSITFSYYFPEKSLNGKMIITKEALQNGTKYQPLLNNNEKASPISNIYWISRKNMTELYLLKETTMDMGNGPENFHKIKNSIIKINYKGKQKVFTVYNIENEKSTIHLSVINDIRNPLIVKSDGPVPFSLKEIR